MIRWQKITFAEMRESGVRGLLVYCAAAIQSRSAAMARPMMPGCPISRSGSHVGSAASAAQTCGRISTGQDGDGDDGLSVGNLNHRPALISSSPVPCPLASTLGRVARMKIRVILEVFQRQARMMLGSFVAGLRDLLDGPDQRLNGTFYM
jgi:hypothetical protein